MRELLQLIREYCLFLLEKIDDQLKTEENTQRMAQLEEFREELKNIQDWAMKICCDPDSWIMHQPAGVKAAMYAPEEIEYQIGAVERFLSLLKARELALRATAQPQQQDELTAETGRMVYCLELFGKQLLKLREAGETMAMPWSEGSHCPRCYNELTPGMRFCPVCGEMLGGMSGAAYPGGGRPSRHTAPACPAPSPAPVPPDMECSQRITGQPPVHAHDAQRARQIAQEEEQRRLLEQLQREQEELRRNNSQMMPPADGMPLPPTPGTQTAADWYRHAADKGNPAALKELAKGYQNGGDAVEEPCEGIPAPVAKPEKKPGLFARLFGGKKKEAEIPADPQRDDVQFRAAAPASIRPGEYFPVKVMMYLESDHARADREQQSLGDKVKSASSSVIQAQQNQKFHIVLQSPDIVLMDCQASLVWNGKYAAADLDVLLPEDFDKKQLRLHGRVYSGAAVLTDVKMILQVDAPQIQEIICEKTVLRSAFVSYASADRAAVASRLQGMQAVAPQMDLFFDVEKLRRGERWEPRLYQEIQKRELFYLFWSRNAANSDWVAKELAYALEQKGPEYIEPVPLEAPDVCPPPAALQDRHFYDWTLRYTNQ